MSGAVPPPAARPLERAARVPQPVCPGCGRCGRVDPAPAPQRAPLRAGVARCGGSGRTSPGGVPSAVVRGAWCQALSLPRPPVLWSGQPGFRCACVFVCVLCLAGSGGPASRARSGAPHLFLWPLCLSALPGPLRAGVAPVSLAAAAFPRCPGALFFFFFFFFLFFFFFFSSRSSFSVRPRCLWLSLVSGPGCLGPRRLRCLLCWPAASRLSVHLFLFRAFRLAIGCFSWLLPPPPPFVSHGFRRRRSVLRAVLCCAWLGAALRRAAARCVARWCAVLCCVALVWCRCLLRRALWRCPSPWGPVLCGAVFCGVPPRCVLCAVCVLSWRGGACCCSPLCFVLCVSRGAVLCVPCALRSARCCALLCWCARVVLFVWWSVAGAWRCGALLCVVLFPVVCRGAVLGLLARGCLLVACFGVGVPVWPRGLLPCGWCGLLWCPAFLCRVLSCCAVAWCCAVALCCRFAVLLGLALPFCGLSRCAVLCCWLAVLFFARWWCLRAVVLFPSCPGAVLPRGAVVSCPVALLGLFLAWVWWYLLENHLQNFV